MPRVSIRRLFVYFLGAASFVLLALNFHQMLVGGSNYTWTGGGSGSSSGSGPSGPSGPSAGSPDQNASAPRNPSANLVLSPLTQNKEDSLSKSKSQRQKLPQVRKDFFRQPLDPDDMSMPDDRPWYMRSGSLQPKQTPASGSSRSERIFPEEAPGEDRILDQLMFLPSTVPENQELSTTPLKKILLWNGGNSWGNARAGRGVFLKEKCPVSSCALTTSRSEAQSADIVMFKDHFTMPTFRRPPSQLWLLYMLECPLHTQMFKAATRGHFNWTATYRTDSTVVAPYERWQYYNENVRRNPSMGGVNLSANKTKAVAWFVSNCGARNGRLAYAKELQKYIQVDIYGSCGTKRCPRSQAKNCFGMLDRDYKFYLAFENSNCKDYITEKFFVNGLGHNLIPIAMGARPEDYERASPEHSYIHVDDFAGPKELADFLHKLDQDDDLYNEYFQWKGTGEFVNTKFWCRVCALLHDPTLPDRVGGYDDINAWWRSQGTCINGSWRKYAAALEKKATSDKEEKKKSDGGHEETAAPKSVGEVVEDAPEAKLP